MRPGCRGHCSLLAATLQLWTSKCRRQAAQAKYGQGQSHEALAGSATVAALPVPIPLPTVLVVHVSRS